MESFHKEPLKPFENLLESLQSMEISFEEAIYLDFEVLKGLLEEIDEETLKNFFQAIQDYKTGLNNSLNKSESGNPLKPFENLLKSLQSMGISFEDAIDLEFEVLKDLFEEIDEAILKNFLQAIQDYKTGLNNSLNMCESCPYDSILKYFGKKEYFSNDLTFVLKNLLEKENIISLDDLLNMQKEKLNSLLLSISKDYQIINKFILILELESFFNKYATNEENKFYDDLITACVHNSIDLQKLAASLKNKTFELILLLSYTNLDKTLPESFLEFLNKNSITLAQLQNLTKEEMMKHGLDESNMSLLLLALENVKQCLLRNFDFWDLGGYFFGNICSRKLSFKEIDNMNEKEISILVSSNPLQEKILNLINQKSQFEICLEHLCIHLPDNPDIKTLKYIEVFTLKTWKLNEYLKINNKFIPFYNELRKKLESYNPPKEQRLNKEIQLLENRLEEIQKHENLIIGSSDKSLLIKEINDLELSLNNPSKDIIDPEPRENKKSIIENHKEILDVQSQNKKQESMIIKKSSKNFCLEISDTIKYDISDEKYLKMNFSEFSKEYPAEAQNFYRDNRKILRNILDFSIEKDYLNELIIKIENNIVEKLNESEKKSNKLKIKNTLKCLIDNIDDLYETFLYNFGNMKSIQIFKEFILNLDDSIPLAFDKCFPPYFLLIQKYKDNMDFVENIMSLSKDLREIKLEEKEQAISDTRNLIKKISKEGNVFLREIYDDYPDLENYLYFDENNYSKIVGSESIENKTITLLKDYYNKIGSSFFDSVLSIDKSLKYIVIQENNCFKPENNREDNLEKLIQRLNNECGEYYKSKLLEKYPELSCTKIIKPTHSKSLLDLLSHLNNEIDPLYINKIFDKYPKYRNVRLNEKKENDETISDILEKINNEIGYYLIESLYDEFDELRQIKIKSNPNRIIPSNLNQKNFENTGNKLKRKEELSGKIRMKIYNKTSSLYNIENSIENHHAIDEGIFQTLQEKEKIEKELKGLMNEKNKIIEDAKYKVPDMIKTLENIYRIFKYLNSVNDKIVKEIFDLNPDLHKIISLPLAKNDNELVMEEFKIGRLYIIVFFYMILLYYLYLF